jgi:hypothetical protein
MLLRIRPRTHLCHLEQLFVRMSDVIDICAVPSYQVLPVRHTGLFRAFSVIRCTKVLSSQYLAVTASCASVI